MNDATAFLRSYASKRGRNVELAETAVVDGKALTETEALDGKLVDLIATSPEDLLSKLDGRTIKRFNGASLQLALHNAERVPFPMSFRERFLSRIVQPDAFFILLIVGVLGLYTGVHPSGHGGSGCVWRNFAGVGAVRDAYSTGSSRWRDFDSPGARIIYSGGEVHESRRARDWWYRGHAAGRVDAGAVAVDACVASA